jgi:crossover junction endodeoxyribonuclease RuvC
VIIAGLDPGKTGALVVVYPDNSIMVLRVPLQKLRGKERPAWAGWAVSWMQELAFAAPDMFVIEDVHARPGQGVTSMFNFGLSYGFARGLIAAQQRPMHFVTPSVWKSKMGLLNSNKDASREEARRLLPQLAGDLTRVKDDGVAEAALLALYGRKHLVV